jgi:hypothetical protein
MVVQGAHSWNTKAFVREVAAAKAAAGPWTGKAFVYVLVQVRQNQDPKSEMRYSFTLQGCAAGAGASRRGLTEGVYELDRLRDKVGGAGGRAGGGGAMNKEGIVFCSVAPVKKYLTM